MIVTYDIAVLTADGVSVGVRAIRNCTHSLTPTLTVLYGFQVLKYFHCHLSPPSLPLSSTPLPSRFPVLLLSPLFPLSLSPFLPHSLSPVPSSLNLSWTLYVEHFLSLRELIVLDCTAL